MPGPPESPPGRLESKQRAQCHPNKKHRHAHQEVIVWPDVGDCRAHVRCEGARAEQGQDLGALYDAQVGQDPGRGGVRMQSDRWGDASGGGICHAGAGRPCKASMRAMSSPEYSKADAG